MNATICDDAEDPVEGKAAIRLRPHRSRDPFAPAPRGAARPQRRRLDRADRRVALTEPTPIGEAGGIGVFGLRRMHHLRCMRERFEP
jgi:hypothetical protein